MKEYNNSNFLLKTNPSTNFLKLIALFTMIVDHFGMTFFPSIGLFRIIGRISFPLFSYCSVVATVHTKNFKNYLIRLLFFAFISQLPYYLLCYYGKTYNIFFSLNIFFTLLLNVLFIYGLKEKKNFTILISILLAYILPIQYKTYSFLFVSSIYIFRKNKKLSFLLAVVVNLVRFFTSKNLIIFGTYLGLQGFAILALPLIFLNIKVDFNINKYIFYLAYPLHHIVFFIIKLFI